MPHKTPHDPVKACLKGGCIPSKLNLRARVPTTADTVTTPYDVLSVVGVPSTHANVVPDVHDVVRHGSRPMAEPVGVKPYEPKFSPLIVTAVDPLDAPL